MFSDYVISRYYISVTNVSSLYVGSSASCVLHYFLTLRSRDQIRIEQSVPMADLVQQARVPPLTWD